AQKQIVLSSDAPPNDIPALEDRLVSRFNSGLVTRIEQPDYETRMAILRQKAEIRALDLPREVAAFVARRIESNIRELEGVLNQLQVRSEVMNTPISEQMVREILAEKLPKKTSPIHIMTIIEHVARWYGQKTADLIARGRTPSVAWPRQVAMYLAREMTSQSYKDIGSHFGGRDHTTVLHAIKQVGGRRQRDAAVHAEVEQIEQQVRDAHQYGDI
ncbi:MAG: helix-turn-helix domain-containing protein, partial [Planctomycetota bacterium]